MSAVTLIIGENTYASKEVVCKITEEFTGEVERPEGSELEVRQLPDLLMGATLFASQRLIIIKELSANTAVWSELPRWLDRLSSDTQLVLIEPKPDKRTKTYKTLQQKAEVITCDELNEAQAIAWLLEVAKARGGTIDRGAARELVERVGADQWRLDHALEKLLLVGDTSRERIRDVIEATPQAQAFALLDAAFQGRKEEVRALLADCVAEEDPYKFFGLLAHQIFQLASVASAPDKSPEHIAKDIGSHPYPLKKLQPLAKKLSKSDLSRVVKIVARLDDQMKSSVGEPWMLIELALLRISQR